MKHLKIGIIGTGVTGGTLYRWLQAHTQHEVFREDPPLGLDEIKEPEKLDAMFICVPVPTIEGQTSQSWIQDTRILKEVIKKYRKYDRLPIFVRSSVLPKTCDSLVKFFKMHIYAMPEFLTARDAYESMCKQDIIAGCGDSPDAISSQLELLENIFPKKKITLMSNREAELAKFAHNCMGAMKVNFCNMIAKYAETIHANYKNVREGFLMSGYINEYHTQVPGPDGKYGFGGTCFPTNILAFYGEAKRLGMHVGSIFQTIVENFIHRTLWSKYFFTDTKHLKVELKE